jgi:transposase
MGDRALRRCEVYREMPKRIAQERGIETPTTDDLIRMDRRRNGKPSANDNWVSPTVSDAQEFYIKDSIIHL